MQARNSGGYSFHVSSEIAPFAFRSVGLLAGLLVAMTALASIACSFPDYSFSSSTVELCTNHLDDDGDGETDCEDLDCVAARYQCVPAVPPEWTGPVAFWTDNASVAAPECSASGGYSVDVPGALKGEVSDAPLGCPDCVCNGEATAQGKSLTVRFGKQCPGACIWGDLSKCALTVEEGCNAIPMSRGDLASEFVSSNTVEVAMQILSVNLSGGTCQVVEAPVPPLPDDGYLLEGKLCRTPEVAGSCALSQESCVKLPDAPFEQKVCIYKKNQEGKCPDGWTGTELVRYAAVKDTRGCEKCTCKPDWTAVPVDASISECGNDAQCSTANSQMVANYNPAGNSCSGSVQYFGSSDKEDRYYRVEVTPGAATCPTTQGVETGAVTPSSPTTICCID